MLSQILRMGEQQHPFTFEVKTTGVDETFTLPLTGYGEYDFKVFWGDGNSDEITVYTDVAKTHTYATAGTHLIQITGTITGLHFDGGGDCTKVYDIKSWGPFKFIGLAATFYGCSNLTVSATDTVDLSGVTSFTETFRNCSSLTSVPSINNWDFSSVVSMEKAFRLCSNFNQSLDLNTSSNKNLSETFAYCGSLNSPVILDTTNTTTARSCFYNCSIFNQSLASWNVESLTDASTMFYGATLSTVNYDATLISWATQSVQTGVPFHGGFSKYSPVGAVGRTVLTDTNTWSITDGGLTT